MNGEPRIVEIAWTGTEFLMAATYFSGALVCFAFRRISRPLMMVSVGFMVQCLVSATQLASAMSWRFYPASLFPSYRFYLGMNFIDMLSKVVVVFGLGLALTDIRRKLGMVMESNNDRT